LLCRLLRSFRLGEREPLGLFAARGAFSYVVSALAVSHRTFTLTLSRPVPSDFAFGVRRWAFSVFGRHNRTGADNADAHLKRQIMGREVIVAITKGKLDFGP
jgi:Uncharacterised protein family UPF0047